jgi:ribosomal-protein-alanine N-acetyltransferase
MKQGHKVRNIDLEIRELNALKEAEECARFMSASEPWITLRRDYDLCLKMLSDPARESYVVYLRQEIAGFMILQMRGPFVGFIQTVGVKPEFRNKGIGTSLLKFAEERILKETPNIFMCVSSFNPKAKQLYQRLGYQVIGELKDFIVPRHSEILLRKTIAPISEFKKADNSRKQSISNRVTVRLAKLEDMETLCNLYIEFHQFHVRGVPDRLVSLEKMDSNQVDELRRNIEKIINGKDSEIMIAQNSNKVIGLGEIYLRKDNPHPAKVSCTYGHLQSLVVTEASRQYGVGKILVEVAEKWAKEKGAAEMRLDIWEFREGPLRFYEKLGYRTLRRNLVRKL